MIKMSTCLWFDGEATLEAAKFYVSVFKGKLGKIAHYTDAGLEVHGRRPGSVMTVEFEILGQQFLALNGGPHYKFNEAVSLVVNCDTQEEIDHYWKKLTDGGQEVACGWLKDKYGLSWQVVPTIVSEMNSDPDPKKSGRVMNAFMKMKKFDIDTLKKAYAG